MGKDPLPQTHFQELTARPCRSRQKGELARRRDQGRTDGDNLVRTVSPKIEIR